MAFSLFLLFAFLFLGQCIQTLTGWPVPGSVWGMLLMLAFLLWRKGGHQSWSLSGDFLIKNLALLFVPAGVGLLVHGSDLTKNFWGLILVLIPGTIAILILSALIAQFFLKDQSHEP